MARCEPSQRRQMVEHAREARQKGPVLRPPRRRRRTADPACGVYFVAPPLLRAAPDRHVAHVQACGRHLEPFFVPAAPRLA